MDKKPDWEISELYSRAWEVIKKYKILWIFGVAAGVGEGMNFRGNSFTDTASKSNPNFPPEFSASILKIFSHVPVWIYVLGALELIAVIGLGIGVLTVYKAWAHGLLIKATSTALEDKPIHLPETSKAIFPKIWSLVWLQIVPSLFFVAALISATLIIVVIALLAPVKLFAVLLGIIALGAAIYWGIYLIATLIWAPREVVLNNKNGKESFFLGYRLARKKFWPMLLLGVVNTLLSAVVMIVPLILLGGLIFASFFLHLPVLTFAGILAIIPAIFGLILLGGVIEAFKATVWTDAYLKIKDKYK